MPAGSRIDRPSSGSAFHPSLGLVDAVAIGLGAIIGGGIFVVLGVVAGLAGPGLLVSILVAGALSFLTARSFVALVRWRPAEGAVYEYATALISPAAGFLAAWIWTASNLFAASAVALGIAHYLAGLFPGLPVKVMAAAFCAGFAALNYFGARRSAAFNNLLVAGKILVLAVFVVAGLLHFKSSNFAPFIPSGRGLLGGAFYIFFAFAGFARVAVLAEEVKDPLRTIPRAVILSLALSTAVYLAVGAAAIGLVGARVLSRSASPLADAIRVSGSPFLVALVSLGGIIAMASVLLTTLMGVSRMVHALARQGRLPAALAAVHPKYDTPHRAILATSAIVILLVVLIDLFGVIAVSTFASLFYYALANYSALKLAGRRGGGRLIPAAAAVLCLAFLLFVPVRSLIFGAALLSVGLAVHVLNRSRKE